MQIKYSDAMISWLEMLTNLARASCLGWKG